jgi:putative ABC transport system permease protein
MSRCPGYIRFFLRVFLPADEADRAVEYLEDLSGANPGVGFWFPRHALLICLRHRAQLRDGTPRYRRRIPMQTTWSNLLLDLRFAFRSLKRHPGFAAVAVITLAVGFGVNISMFSIVRRALLEQLPFPDSEELVKVWSTGGEDYPITAARFADYTARGTETVSLTAYSWDSFALLGGDTPIEIDGARVSWNHFDVLGLRPVMGRGFTESDSDPGAEPVVIIGHDLWIKQFQGDSSVIGRQVELYRAAAIPMISGAFSGVRLRVIGVLPKAYKPFGDPVSVLTPLVMDPASASYNDLMGLQLIGRTLRGADARAVRDEMFAIESEFATAEHIEALRAQPVVGMRPWLIGDSRRILLLLQGAVVLLLVLASANVANLVLVRHTRRQRELGVRMALGAGRRRLIQQLVIESTVLSVLGGVAGVVLSVFSIDALSGTLPGPLAVDARVVDPMVLGAGVAVMALVGLLTGLLPALRGTSSIETALREGRTGSHGGTKVVASLVAIQVALAVVLASSAGLTLKSFLEIASVGTGINTANAYTIRVAPVEARYADVAVRRQFIEEVKSQFQAIPGVVHVGATHFLPVGDGGVGIGIRPPTPSDRSSVVAAYKVITPGYLDAIGVPTMQGRNIKSTDIEGGSAVALVNQAFVDEFMEGEPPLGTPLIRMSGDLWATIVGVVGNMRQEGPMSEAYSEVYLPLAQSSWASAMSLVVKTEGPIPGMDRQMKEIIARIDPNVPVERATTLEEIVRSSYATQRFFSYSFGAFAAMALLLGCVGVYGIASFAVSSRKREMGIMLALGAPSKRIAVTVLKIALLPAAIGLVIGMVATLAAGKLVGSILYQVTPYDPLVLASTAGLLALAVIATNIGPIRRGINIDPVTELRDE